MSGRSPRLLALLWLGVACSSGKDDATTTTRDGVAQWEDWAQPADCAPTTFYEDLDGDGFGVDGTGVSGETCRPPDRHAERSGDCDDRASSVHPEAPELCDGVDNNCNGNVDDDEGSVVGAPDWFTDLDGDGYGTASSLAANSQCVGPEGSSTLTGDCDDTDPSAHPGRSEDLTDGIDNNCDGLTDLHGELEGTWTIAVGSGPEPGARDCEEVWEIDGFWSPDICPDCTLSFWNTASGLDGSGRCTWPLDPEFGLHVLAPYGSDLLLAVSRYQEGSVYYDYYYGYYSIPGEYVRTDYPDASVEWEGAHLSFELGGFDVPVEVDGGTEYRTDGWRFEGVIE